MTKKHSRKKATREVAPEHELPGGWWRQVAAILMIVLAVIFVMTWFGEGGNFFNLIHQFCWQIMGYALYLLPVLLVYLAVKVFRTPGNVLPWSIWLAAALLLIWGAGITGIPTIGAENPTGGLIGEGLNAVMTQILDPSIVVFIYIVLIFITGLFITQTNPATVFSAVVGLFRNSDKTEERDNSRLMKKAEKAENGLKITGVTAEELKESTQKPLRVNAAAKSAPETVSEKALVATADPNWKLPAIDLLSKAHGHKESGDIPRNAEIIRATFAEFGIDVEMEGANVGPRITQYTMRPPRSVPLSKILVRDKELALNLAVDKIRIEAPIPGTQLVGVEIPNLKSEDVRLREVLASEEWKTATDPLTFAVGKDISGRSVIANLAKMPHLLIAGTTGSGKSVMTNTLISSLLYRNGPNDLKLIIVDPKQVEMAQYDGIPHLLTPIITSVEKTLSAMKWAVNEMELRYTLMAEKKVKNIVSYNQKMAKLAEIEVQKAAKAVQNAEISAKTENPDSTPVEPVENPVENSENPSENHDRMPYIVIIIDEMSDLMMMAGKDLEMLIVRIAQKGRACGIHLVLATQRPEVKVITGLIKANIPGRIAFAVGSQMDSRIMLDMGGAEKLLGKGDMLLLTTEMMGKPQRIQGAFSPDEDVSKVCSFLRAQRAPAYNDEVISQVVQVRGMGPADGGAIGDLGRKYDPSDPIVRKAVEISIAKGKFSTAMLQTYLGKGHGFVSGLAVWFEELGIIGPANGNKPRDVLISSMEEFDQKTVG